MKRESHRRIAPPTLTRPRELRQPLTPAEIKLWKCLRNRQLGGLKFRRQFPIGTFIVDFCCTECRLIVEVDGPSHSEPHQLEYDKARTEWLTERGYRLLRFWNNDIREHIDTVLEMILSECGTRP